MRGDGPLPFHYRHYIAIMVSWFINTFSILIRIYKNRYSVDTHTDALEHTKDLRYWLFFSLLCVCRDYCPGLPCVVHASDCASTRARVCVRVSDRPSWSSLSFVSMSSHINWKKLQSELWSQSIGHCNDPVLAVVQWFIQKLLTFIWRWFCRLQAAGRHQCSYLIQQQVNEFLQQGGDERWLQGLHSIPAKLRDLYEINKILAHRPWLITKDHIEVRRPVFYIFFSFAKDF